MKQQTLAKQVGFEKFGRKSKCELFLEEMDRIVPGPAWLNLSNRTIPRGNEVVRL
jgi:hypothetical protein